MTILQKIDPARCGCDDPVIVGKLIAIDEAFALIGQRARPIAETEEVALGNACGRVLARAVRSRAMVPPFDNSAMDGYALSTAALTGTGPWQLAVTDRIAAGQTADAPLAEGSAVQVFTGAPIPIGADAVVMQEVVTPLNGTIIILNKVEPGAHIRRAGEDMAEGAEIVPAGRCLTARDIAACAAAGHATLLVRRRIRVALLVTGDEVASSGQARGNAAIWDVNSPMIGAELRSPRIDFCGVEVAGDSPRDLKIQLKALAKSTDLIVTTGGISVGEEDHVKAAVSDLGGAIVFSGVAVKPGKPVSFGHIGATQWLGLPGNPLSALLTWKLFGPALCRRLTGDRGKGVPRRHVVLSRALHHKSGRCELRLTRLSGFDDLGREIADFDDATHSARVAKLPEADGVLVIPAETETLPKGALVEFQPFGR